MEHHGICRAGRATKKLQRFHTPPAFNVPVDRRRRNFAPTYAWGYQVVNYVDDILNHFYRTPACDRRPDKHQDRFGITETLSLH